jgi:hypothetical protein
VGSPRALGGCGSGGSKTSIKSSALAVEEELYLRSGLGMLAGGGSKEGSFE